MPSCLTCGESNLESARFCSSCGARLEREPTATVEVRKTVTVVFADVVGSTSLVDKLDPESARRVLDRFFETMRVVVERHGGTVEKFIGDAVMAVFGIPVLHEDDALRAVRAASEMRAALEGLNVELRDTFGASIQMRVGVETGEVVAGDPGSGQAFATGDAVNVAARLESAARPGEILLGGSTYHLLRHALTVESIGPLTLKGRTESVTAYRLLATGIGTRSRRLESRLVGRGHELDLLSEAFERVVVDRSSRLVTVIGEAGVGKSRLADEFVNARSSEATIIRGRCLPYGAGITWPLKEAIGEAAGLVGGESPDDARAKIRRLVESTAEADLIVERMAETIGLAETVPEHLGSTWAARRLFEEIARQRPLIVVFDDIQWAETNFLDLVEDVVQGSGDMPALVLCMARPELLDLRLSWASAETRAKPIFLEPLSDEESERMIGNLLDGGELDEVARTRIVEASDGLPLFVEEMVAMLLEEGVLRRQDGRWLATDLSRISAPATIHALLAARLDRLDVLERALLARGSIEGQVFHRGAVVCLSPEPERAGIQERLTTLAMKELIRPESAVFADEDAYRFHHLLFRDVAYESLRKEERATLHDQYAGWLEGKAGERTSEYDEILGYHLEQACRYENELRAGGTVEGELAGRAAERLGSAGLRAHARGDWSAAANLLSRALGLLAQDNDARAKLEPKLDDALLEMAPARGGFLSSLRCFWHWPFGHKWTVRERDGDLMLRCPSCGQEKPVTLRWRTYRAPRSPTR